MSRLRLTPQAMAAIPLAIGLNLALAFIVNLLRLPLFLDSAGTVLVGALFGPAIGALTGALSNSIAGLVLNPVYFYFIPTACFIGAAAGWTARRIRFRPGWRVVLAGAIVGILAAIISAPIATFALGGVTPAGSYSVIVAFLKASGRTMLKSTVLAGVGTDPVDKAASFLLASLVVAGLPAAIRARLQQAPAGDPLTPGARVQS